MTAQTDQSKTFWEEIGGSAYHKLIKAIPKAAAPGKVDANALDMSAMLALQAKLEEYYAISWWKINARKQYLKDNPTLKEQTSRTIDPNTPRSLTSKDNDTFARQQLLYLSDNADYVEKMHRFIQNAYYLCTHWWDFLTRKWISQIAQRVKEHMCVFRPHPNTDSGFIRTLILVVSEH